MARQTDPHEEMADMACFVISVAARLLNVHPQTLRYYDGGPLEPDNFEEEVYVAGL